jgi:tripartite-type tricarboxylate transporter receptor subunit TctC
MSSIKRFVTLLGLGVASVAFNAQAAYPDKPIKIVVPYSAGGSSDVIARAISDQMSAALGQSVLVENRPGAGSMIATTYVANEPADGYTLLLADVPFTIVPALYKERVKYDVEKDFAPISLLGTSPAYLFVNPEFPAQNVGELIASAKEKPGLISIGSGGNGSLTHLLAELFMLNTDTKLVHVPYKGAASSMNDLAGGQINASFTTMATATALYQGKKIRPLAVTSATRQAATPDVPTFEEAGIPGMTVESWWGLMAPIGTPAPAVEALRKTMATVMQSEKVKQRLVSVGVNPPVDSSAETLGKLLKVDLARWKEVVERAHVTLE